MLVISLVLFFGDVDILLLVAHALPFIVTGYFTPSRCVRHYDEHDCMSVYLSACFSQQLHAHTLHNILLILPVGAPCPCSPMVKPLGRHVQ